MRRQEQPAKPTTTTEQDLRTAGQRRINLIWEYTQAGIAVVVVASTIAYVFTSAYKQPFTTSNLLENAFFLVIGFYFGRTNHARIGDIPKEKALDDR